MKKIVWVIMFVYSCVLSLYRLPPIKCIDGRIKTEIGAIDAQIIMDNLVKESQVEHRQGDIGITYEEAQMLMKVAQAEAGIDGREGMAMVMAVVLNRLEDKRFPNDIEGIIFQIYKGQYQFSTIANGSYYDAEPDIECHLALADIEMGAYDTVDAIFFENAEQSWQQSNCEYLGTVGHHRFYKK